MIETVAPSTPEQKAKVMEVALKEIEKEFGKGSLMLMDGKVDVEIPSIPTGIYGVDYEVLGVGGLPKGRIIEVFGPESSGKTSLALMAIASAQRLGEYAAFIDAEHALDPTWATKLGVDMSKLFVSQPDSGEEALQIVQKLLETRVFGIIVVDSVAALVPKAELDGDIGDANVGMQARLMSQACRKLNALVSKGGCVLLFINQLREKIGVMFGSPETTTGGRALKFYASVRLDIRRIGGVKEGDTVAGNKVKIKAAKNKVAPPFREAEVQLMFDVGFDRIGNLVDVAVERGIVQKSGSWFSIDGERIGQGRQSVVDYVEANDLSAVLLQRIRGLA